MTDEELIARLQDWLEVDEGKINDTREEAADRIEALIHERDAASAAVYEAAGEIAAEFIHRRLYEANMPVCSYHSRDIKTAIRANIPKAGV